MILFRVSNRGIKYILELFDSEENYYFQVNMSSLTGKPDLQSAKFVPAVGSLEAVIGLDPTKAGFKELNLAEKDAGILLDVSLKIISGIKQNPKQMNREN